MNSKYRGIDIIEKAYITDLTMLYANPNIKFVLEAPYNYVVCEFLDKVSEFLLNCEKETKYKFQQNPDIQQKMRDAVREKESLFKPLYEHPRANDSYGYRKPLFSRAYTVFSLL